MIRAKLLTTAVLMMTGLLSMQSAWADYCPKEFTYDQLKSLKNQGEVSIMDPISGAERAFMGNFGGFDLPSTPIRRLKASYGIQLVKESIEDNVVSCAYVYKGLLGKVKQLHLSTQLP